MKKIIVNSFGPPSVMHIEAVETPLPAANEVLVQLAAVGVNPVDTYIRSGAYGKLPQLPYTPGFDGAGTIVALGNNVRHYSEGDRVYLFGSATGTYADHALCSADQIRALPDELNFAQGAAIGIPYATAWRALFQVAKARPGQTVLIRGASGGVGIAATQLARMAGLHIVGTASTEIGKRAVASSGADLVVDHGATEDILAFTNGTGPDIIIEMLANANMQNDLDIAARNGMIVIVGNRGSVTIDPRLIMSKELTVRGVLLFAAPASDLREIHDGLAPGLRDCVLKPIIAKEFNLSDAPAAHEYIIGGNRAGKCVLLP